MTLAFYALMAVKVWALVDALTRPAAAYVAAEKLTKNGWLLILGLTAATVVSALPAVGAILAIALIAAPAAAARLVVPTYRGILLAAPVIGAASGIIGVMASRALAVAAGPSIALAATAFFVLALGISKVRALPLNRVAIPVETAEDARTA